MSEDVARAVGSGGTDDDLIIAGKKCTPRPLSLKELGEIERECLKKYRRSYVETFSDNCDFLSPPERDKLLQAKIEEAARWDISDLPIRESHSPESISISDGLVRWVIEKFPPVGKLSKKKQTQVVRRIAATSLSNGALTSDVYKELTGVDSQPVRIGYANWWMTATYEGQIEVLFACFKHAGVTRDEICAALNTNPDKLTDAAHEIERLTVPDLGNT